MIDFSTSAVAFMGGLLLGLLFFGGLRWTVQHLTKVSRPVPFFLGSFVLRTLTALAGFYVIAAGDWLRLTAVLLGFFTARIGVINLTLDRTTNEVDPHHGTQS